MKTNGSDSRVKQSYLNQRLCRRVALLDRLKDFDQFWHIKALEGGDAELDDICVLQ